MIAFIDPIENLVKKYKEKPKAVDSLENLKTCLIKVIKLNCLIGINTKGLDESSQNILKKINKYSINFNVDANRLQESAAQLNFEILSFLEALNFEAIHFCFNYNLSPFIVSMIADDLNNDIIIPYIKCSFLYSKVVQQIDRFLKQILSDQMIKYTSIDD